MTKHYDAIVIGAGLVGLSTAYHIKLRRPKYRVLILEKDNDVAQHQSGHNSGVVHSGIYYKPGSLKAQNCISGYNELVKFAERNEIDFDICGKIIVATSKSELSALENIYNRGIANGLKGLKLLEANQIKDFEPYVSGIKAIHVPQTGIIDYPALANRLVQLFQEQFDGEILFNERVIKIIRQKEKIMINTSSHTFSTDRLVSCAGLYSDHVASLTETSNDLRIIPFRGEYYKIKPEMQHLVKNLIYPVPDPKFPFLGVHFTRMIKGGIEAGPNAVLAFKREGYKFTDFSFREMTETLSWPGFWKIVAKYGKTGMGEIYRSLSKAAFTKALQKLIPEINQEHLEEGGAGIRAQACARNGVLIDDFDVLESNNVIHVRNAPSPAATSCLAIGNSISERILT